MESEAYTYFGFCYFAVYAEPSRVRTSGKFLVVVVADFLVSALIQLPVMWLIFLSALRF